MKQKPTLAFIAISWIALLIGVSGYLIDLWNAEMRMSEKGYLFIVLMYGLFAGSYYGFSWLSTTLSVLLLIVGLWNVTLFSSEKGFYSFAFLLSMFGAMSIHRNIRDLRGASTS
jgi:uncharacterized membrane protein YiaA